MAYTEPSAKGRAASREPVVWNYHRLCCCSLSRSGEDDRAKTFMNDIKNNGVKMTTSNGESTDFVATGQVELLAR